MSTRTSAADSLSTQDPQDPPRDHAPTVAPGAASSSSGPDGSNGATAAAAEAPPPVRRGRGGRRKAADAAPGAAPRRGRQKRAAAAPKPLSEGELQALGVLVLRAQRAKQPLEEYAEELRLLLSAYDRMREQPPRQE